MDNLLNSFQTSFVPDGRIKNRVEQKRPGDHGDERQNENLRRAASRLPKTHCCAEGITLCQEEHYNMLQADVEELRIRLEEKNKLIEKENSADYDF
ncbi:hypothetical protein CEXT_502171 [Caerostris extrusa]|uniref:Uncharacterized protein n=1 Tax=Caerostris extrusa TaxID=172846 RepID=A0AAV4MXM0_CAEEX|nr:hypothetical protein CEXT_502171 [Caerostris extrusa]